MNFQNINLIWFLQFYSFVLKSLIFFKFNYFLKQIHGMIYYNFYSQQLQCWKSCNEKKRNPYTNIRKIKKITYKIDWFNLILKKYINWRNIYFCKVISNY